MIAQDDEIQQIPPASTGEDVRLEHLGYEQELKRSFGLLGMIGFSFSVVTSWTALSGVFIVGVTSGGPPVMVFSFIGVSLLTLAVAIPMAEMCSMYPVAGGQYSWVAALAPPKIARGLSYITGWFMLIGMLDPFPCSTSNAHNLTRPVPSKNKGLLAMGATNNSIAAQFVLGMANLVFPSYEIQRWQTVLVAYLVALLAAAINIWGPHLLNRLARFILIWNIGAFFITIIVLLATNDHKQPASFVFVNFQNTTGWDKAMAAIVGILQACFGMCCYDAPSHMTEEMKSASKQAPQAIIMSVVLGAVTGFAFLLVLCFCIGDITATANSATGVPVIQIFYDSTGSKAAACVLASMIAVIVIVAGNNILAEGSRCVYAFARDHGLPCSTWLAKVDKKRQVPVNAVLLTLVVQLALDAIDFGTSTGFETVIAISTEGFYLSYATALASRLLGYITSHQKTMTGPFALPSSLSIALNILGLLFLLFASITFNFPTTYPVTDDSMNYTSAAIGVIALIALGTWVSTGRKNFTGPAGGAASQGMVVETGKVVEDVEPEGMSEGMEKKG
ncbi:GABA permease [Aspergillus indologenus CBS 114.80]|uniref:GABA permease n=1 Tax=Aspergillus indologenus CBS 114.80 TaxID=1450541 RepID=A0A2V5I485_9EURO|nr:GABA permease [Aspergillus indologenus CBS 114.80]